MSSSNRNNKYINGKKIFFKKYIASAKMCKKLVNMNYVGKFYEL